jgi:acetyl esterase/lipase
MPRRERLTWFLLAVLPLAAGLMANVCPALSATATAAGATSETDPRLKELLQRFPQADLNRDGVLTAQEVRQARDQFLKQRAGAADKAGAAGKAAAAAALKPTFADVRYGPHERNVLDFWKADSKDPAPLVVFIHGGGFVGGDKSRASPVAVKACLDAGVSYMSISYRFLKDAPIQDILRDAARAIQFVRQNAKEYNLDPKRIASYGGSAGAGTSLWLAVHDDLADPKAEDPVLRQSSRIVAAGCLNGQATYDLTEWETFLGPWKKEWMRSPTEMAEFYHFKTDEDLKKPENKKVLDDCSMLRLISRDDPPIFMVCGLPDTDATDRNHLLHHPRHALAVKKACDAAGVECVAAVGDGARQGERGLLEFFFKHLKVERKPIPETPAQPK